MKYPFWCFACRNELLVDAPISEGPKTPHCPYGHGVMQRVWTPPIINVPEMNAADVLERHYYGRGDPAPGMDQAQTMTAARALHSSIKKNKGQKASSAPTISTPAMPGAHTYHGPE